MPSRPVSSTFRSPWLPLQLGFMAFVTQLGTAGESEPGGALPTLVEQEIIRRQGSVAEAQQAMADGDLLTSEGNWAAAAAKYYEAGHSLSESPATLATKRLAAQKLAEVTIHLAPQQAQGGNFEAAKRSLEMALEQAPTNPDLRLIKKRLDDPDYYNPAASPAHAAKVDKVQNLLKMAEGHIDLGTFDAAQAAYNQVLAVDPHNTAARRGLERTEGHYTQYLRSARDHTRARALREVDAQWETAVPRDSKNITAAAGEGKSGIEAGSGVTGKLRSLVMPKLSLEGATLDEVVNYLRGQSKQLDMTGTGLSFVVRLGEKSVKETPSVTLNLENVPMIEALNYITEQTGTKWSTESGIVVISSLTGAGGRLEMRNYSVPPDFMTTAVASSNTTAADPFSGGGVDVKAGAVKRVGAKEFLESAGVEFPAGGTAEYVRATGKLVVRLTEAGHDQVQSIIDELFSKSPRQALVRVYSLEVGEQELKEIGFDFLLGQFNAGSSYFGSGGTYGSTSGGQAPLSNFAFQDPSTLGGALPSPVGGRPITAGLRSSTDLRTGQTIDDIIGRVRRGTTPGRAPGSISLSGVFTDPQWQTISRLLNQKRGKDFTGGASVILKSGQVAKAQSTRTMMVPTDFDPPQIPQTFSNQGDINIFIDDNGGLAGVEQEAAGTGAPVTPTTPTSFEEKEIGLEIEVEATIPEEGNLVELTISPNFSEFEGFINYGSPILTGAGVGSGDAVEVTRNEILQAVIRRMKVEKSTLSIYDGSTIVFAGLKEERTTKVEDKVPLLGDIPLVGRLFKSNVDETTKKSIIFFVQVNILDPAGNRVSQAGANIPK